MSSIKLFVLVVISVATFSSFSVHAENDVYNLSDQADVERFENERPSFSSCDQTVYLYNLPNLNVDTVYELTLSKDVDDSCEISIAYEIDELVAEGYPQSVKYVCPESFLSSFYADYEVFSDYGSQCTQQKPTLTYNLYYDEDVNRFHDEQSKVTSCDFNVTLFVNSDITTPDYDASIYAYPSEKNGECEVFVEVEQGELQNDGDNITEYTCSASFLYELYNYDNPYIDYDRYCNIDSEPEDAPDTVNELIVTVFYAFVSWILNVLFGA